MATKKDKSAKEQFKKAKTKKTKKPAAKKEQPYTGGADWCGTNRSNRTPGWIRREQW